MLFTAYFLVEANSVPVFLLSVATFPVPIVFAGVSADHFNWRNSMKLYVGNLCHTATETDLNNLLSPHGSVLKVNLIRDHFTRQSKCFGYVQMSKEAEGNNAIRALHGTKLHDRLLVIKEARTRNERRGHPW
jgi:RNA recognition motif-containing protein